MSVFHVQLNILTVATYTDDVVQVHNIGAMTANQERKFKAATEFGKATRAAIVDQAHYQRGRIPRHSYVLLSGTAIVRSIG